MWRELHDAFKVIGFDDSDVTDIFHLLAVILHIGNTTFDGGCQDLIVLSECAVQA